jgi:hypothetical protein
MRQNDEKIGRVCPLCGKLHKTGLTNMQTGEHEPWDKCYQCVMGNGWTFNPTKEQVLFGTTDDTK